MTAAERGWLLLCADLGDGLTPMTLFQVRVLRAAVREAGAPEEGGRPLEAADLNAMGYGPREADRILRLLSREKELDAYLDVGADHGIRPITRISPDYPSRLRRLGDEAPAVLFLRGDPACLQGPFAAAVGSRELTPEAEAFAGQVGTQAAAEGYTLVSGNARGADRAAQIACLRSGGRVLGVLPDSLAEHEPERGEAFLSEQGWHLPFSSARALRRNLLIHALGELVLVIRTGTSSGTWNGCAENLKRRLSPVFVRRDGSPGAEDLIASGARGIDRLTDFRSLPRQNEQIPL